RKKYVAACSSDTSLSARFSPKSVSGISRPLQAIEQDGDNNFAVAYQEGSEYTLESTQVGSSNVSFAIQEGFRSTATMSQDGVGNRQNVLQQSVDGSLLAEVTQVGNGNDAYVVQVDGEYNGAHILQTGNLNKLDVEQTARFNSLRATQIGSENTVLVNQSGGGTGVTSQSGYANTIELNQSALINGAYTAIDQSGEFNDAKVYQEVGGRYPGGNVILSQDGTGNMADVEAIGGWANIEFSQTGVDNELTSYQSGRANNVKGYSNGDFNQVDIMQDGDGSTLDIAQNGSENVISATQNGALSMVIPPVLLRPVPPTLQCSHRALMERDLVVTPPVFLKMA
ncbi:hypothetical protein, partial [Stutzerimonas stutzeri]|uniref:hypothetical protein n=2 Tax=Stutzerimonas stutzeri TaxID=316 RepID=UPI003711699C